MKLLAIDIDGTLLNNQGEITEVVAASIKKIQAENWKICLCSGRPLPGIQRIIHSLRLPYEDFSIIYNGACIARNDGEYSLDKVQFYLDDYRRLQQFCSEKKLQLIAVDEKRTYLTDKVANLSTIRFCWLTKTLLSYQDLFDFSEEQSFMKFMICNEEDRITEYYPEFLTEFAADYNVFRSEAEYLDIAPHGIDKGTALERLSNFLHISPRDIVAIGDNDNDCSMLNYAGIGIAMGNGTEKAQQIADWTCPSNEENGVARAIDFLLK